jgi:hypothetical protein
MLILTDDGSRVWHNLAYPWTGVALACRFRTDRVARAPDEELEPEVQAMIARLKVVR